MTIRDAHQLFCQRGTRRRPQERFGLEAVSGVHTRRVARLDGRLSDSSCGTTNGHGVLRCDTHRLARLR